MKIKTPEFRKIKAAKLRKTFYAVLRKLESTTDILTYGENSDLVIISKYTGEVPERKVIKYLPAAAVKKDMDNIMLAVALLDVVVIVSVTQEGRGVKIAIIQRNYGVRHPAYYY